MIRDAVLLAVILVVAYSALRIGEIILARRLGNAVGGLISGVVDGVLAEQRMHAQHSNHARFEGTWTPHELQLRVAGRELDRLERGCRTQAAVHGVELSDHFGWGGPAEFSPPERLSV